MANESINLNLIPTGEMPVIHVSQFDNGRAFNVNLFKGSDEYTIPEGYTAELHCRKADRNIVTLATTNVSSNTLTFTTTTQLCACAGDNLCEVAIKDTEDYLVGSLNFILQVEKDPLQGGIESTSSIHDLTDQIEEITTEIVGENYYTKTETDTLLDAKADASSVYTKTQTDNLLSAKADASSVYTKTQTDNLLSAKADASSVYTKTQTDNLLSAKANTSDLATVATTGDYDDLTNKPTIPAAQVQSDYAQVDNTKVDYIKNKPDIAGMIAAAIYAIMPESTVTGACASFNTDFEKPLTALTVDNSATKLMHMAGDALIGNYFSGLFSGNCAFLDLFSLNWIMGNRNTDDDAYTFYYNLTGMKSGGGAIADNFVFNPNMSSWESLKKGEFGITDTYLIFAADYNSAYDFKNSMQYHYLIYELDTAVTPSITDSQFETLCEAFNIENEIFTLPVSSNPVTYNGDNNFFTDNGDITVSYKESIQHYIDERTGT